VLFPRRVVRFFSRRSPRHGCSVCAVAIFMYYVCSCRLACTWVWYVGGLSRGRTRQVSSVLAAPCATGFLWDAQRWARHGPSCPLARWSHSPPPRAVVACVHLSSSCLHLVFSVCLPCPPFTPARDHCSGGARARTHTHTQTYTSCPIVWLCWPITYHVRAVSSLYELSAACECVVVRSAGKRISQARRLGCVLL